MRKHDDKKNPGEKTHPAKNDEVRRNIMRTAQEYFFTYGFVSVTLSKLASEMGMSKKTIYKYFASKEQLIEEIIEQLHADAEAWFGEILDKPEISMTEKLKAIIRYKIEVFSKIKPPFLRDIRQIPKIIDKVIKLQKNIIPACFGVLFDKGRETGLIRKEFDPQFLSEILFASIEGIMDPDKLYKLSMTTEQALLLIFNLFFHGILVEED